MIFRRPTDINLVKGDNDPILITFTDSSPNKIDEASTEPVYPEIIEVSYEEFKRRILNQGEV